MGLKRIQRKKHSIEETDLLECPFSLMEEFRENVFKGMKSKLPSSAEMAKLGVLGEDADFEWELFSISLSKYYDVKDFSLLLVENTDEHGWNIVQQYDFENCENSVLMPSMNDVLSGKNDTGDVYRKCCWGNPVECKNEIFDFTPYIESLKKRMQSPDVKVQILERKVEELQGRLNSLEHKKKFRLGL